MARIRTIKPEFFTSEDIVSLTPLARLLYVALWCEADREGRLNWKTRTFKMRYLPADECDIEALCAELLKVGLVKPYGEGLAYIPKFSEHQHVNPREAASSLPDPHASRTRQGRVGTRASTVSDAQGGREGKGKEGDVARVADGDDEQPGEAPPPVGLIPLIDGSEYLIFGPQAAEWIEAFPAVDVLQELREIRVWCIANPTNRKTRGGAQKFIVKWLSKAQDEARAGRARAYRKDDSATDKGFI